jgi:aspartyl protease family protein
MGLYNYYWRERQLKGKAFTKNDATHITPNKRQIHPLFSVLLAFVIVWFGISKLKLPNNAPNPGSLSGKTTDIIPNMIPGGLVVYADAQGHYRGTLKINDISARFMIDTGATTVVIPAHIAYQAGLKIGQPIMADTAGGKVIQYSSIVDRLTFGNALLHNVPVHINQHINEILIGVDLMKLFKIIYNRDSMILAIDNGRGENAIKAFDPQGIEFSKVEKADGSSGIPMYSTPSTMLTEKTKAQITWTKTITCDKNSRCKTSYH